MMKLSSFKGKREKKARLNRLNERLPKAWVGRRRFVLIIFAILGLALVARAFEQQIIQKDFLQSEGNERYLATVKIPGQRGIIKDRQNQVLAMSAPMDSIAANPRLLTDRNHKAIQAIAAALQLSPQQLQQKLYRYRHRYFVYLKRRLPPEQAEQVLQLAQRLQLRPQALHKLREYQRFYPAGSIFAHIIGFTNIDGRGQEGLELYFDRQLAGQDGLKKVIKNGRGQIVAEVEQLKPAIPGQDLQLSLDQRVQYIAYRELKKAVQKHHADGGSMVILDVQTGEVLAMVNQPSYNPNAVAQSRLDQRRNRAVTDLFEPGSTMKPLTIAIGLELGKIRADSHLNAQPFRIGGKLIRDHHDLGRVSIETIIQKSSNVGAAKIALMLPKYQYESYLRKIGFGAKTGIEYPGEAKGILRSAKRWYPVDQAILAYGYGLSVSTLQLAQAYAILARDGIKIQPTLLKRKSLPQGERIFSAQTARSLRRLMRSVVAEGGTATRAAIEGYEVAGKTGTAKKLVNGHYSRQYIAVFAGMVPVENPRFVAVVMVDNPKGKVYYGGLVAAPVFSSVLSQVLKLFNIPPQSIKTRS